jgi:hypothetical protein
MFGKQESNEFRIPAELAALEKQLAGLTAAPARVDRDRVMFEAGRAAGARGEERGSRSESLLRSRFWPGATLAMTAATLLLAAMLVWPTAWRGVGAKPPAMEVVATANIAAQVANPVAAYPVTWTGYDRTPPGYLGIRYVALTRGVDALAHERSTGRDDPAAPVPPADAQKMLQELLPKTTQKSI